MTKALIIGWIVVLVGLYMYLGITPIDLVYAAIDIAYVIMGML